MFEELLTEVSLENTLYRMLSWPRLHPDQNQAYSWENNVDKQQLIVNINI